MSRHLTPGQLDRYRGLLYRQRALATGRVRNLDSEPALRHGRGMGWHARPSDEEVGTRLKAADLTAVERIDDALARIAAGTYGRCAECGEAISPKRLEALPEATFCLACREAADRGDWWPT